MLADDSDHRGQEVERQDDKENHWENFRLGDETSERDAIVKPAWTSLGSVLNSTVVLFNNHPDISCVVHKLQQSNVVFIDHVAKPISHSRWRDKSTGDWKLESFSLLVGHFDDLLRLNNIERHALMVLSDAFTFKGVFRYSVGVCD
jgi:hypothetical protein